MEGLCLREQWYKQKKYEESAIGLYEQREDFIAHLEIFKKAFLDRINKIEKQKLLKIIQEKLILSRLLKENKIDLGMLLLLIYLKK